MGVVIIKTFIEFKALFIIISYRIIIIYIIHYCSTTTARLVEKPFKVNFKATSHFL